MSSIRQLELVCLFRIESYQRMYHGGQRMHQRKSFQYYAQRLRRQQQSNSQQCGHHKRHVDPDGVVTGAAVVGAAVVAAGVAAAVVTGA